MRHDNTTPERPRLDADRDAWDRWLAREPGQRHPLSWLAWVLWLIPASVGFSVWMIAKLWMAGK